MKVHCSRDIRILTLLLFAALAAGCGAGAKPPSVVTADSNSGAQQLPFAAGKTLVVPANTAVCIRVQQAISRSTAQGGQAFAAVLAEPLVVGGQRFAPQGTLGAGRHVA